MVREKKLYFTKSKYRKNILPESLSVIQKVELNSAKKKKVFSAVIFCHTGANFLLREESLRNTHLEDS